MLQARQSKIHHPIADIDLMSLRDKLELRPNPSWNGFCAALTESMEVHAPGCNARATPWRRFIVNVCKAANENGASFTPAQNNLLANRTLVPGFVDAVINTFALDAQAPDIAEAMRAAEARGFQRGRDCKEATNHVPSFEDEEGLAPRMSREDAERFRMARRDTGYISQSAQRVAWANQQSGPPAHASANPYQLINREADRIKSRRHVDDLTSRKADFTGLER